MSTTRESPSAAHSERDPEFFLQRMIRLAESAPKIGSVSLNRATAVTPFRQNFYKRFEELHAISHGLATHDQIIYTRMIKERFGFDLLRFYSDNQILCESVYTAIEAKEPYDRLLFGRKAILGFENQGVIAPGSAGQIDAATGHELGIEAVGLFFWDRINPLLSEAYSIIEPKTLNAPFLTR